MTRSFLKTTRLQRNYTRMQKWLGKCFFLLVLAVGEKLNDFARYIIV